ncbi:MAG: photosynthetic reaction center cytochrome c subunit [Bdellovibrionales bacterium]|nr:photosynthetic reaction center cytochrome c subunit [Bdellovibrionales bacterium]
MKKLILLFCGIISVYSSQAQVPKKIKATEEEIRSQMLTISRQLGVTCSECHNIKNFTDSSKPSFKISLKHMKMVELLRQNGYSGQGEPEISCYTCHKGSLKFTYKEPLTDHNRHDLNKKKPPVKSPELATKSTN